MLTFKNWLQNKIPRGGFKENFLALASGTTISQVIGLLCMPILTRLYGPDAFGRFGIYYAIISILGSLSTGRLELGIVLPESNVMAKKLWRVCVRVTCILTALFSL